eukprot:70520-Pelagomonas_calceolata.AAC.1
MPMCMPQGCIAEYHAVRNAATLLPFRQIRCGKRRLEAGNTNKVLTRVLDSGRYPGTPIQHARQLHQRQKGAEVWIVIADDAADNFLFVLNPDLKKSKNKEPAAAMKSLGQQKAPGAFTVQLVSYQADDIREGISLQHHQTHVAGCIGEASHHQ